MTTIYTPIDVYDFAKDGNVDELIIALNQGNNSTNWYRDGSGWTALHVAAINGFMNIVEILLNRGIDINSKDNNGNTALHYAAYNGNMGTVEILLNRGIDINSKNNDGITALHSAAIYGHMNIVEILLEKGIDISSKTNDGATALNIAARYGFMNTVEILLDRGIDINSKDNDGNTALHRAASNGHMNIVEILLERGIAINDDINKYAPSDWLPNRVERDCRPLILAEIDHRRKRALFDSFINHHIEYQPYINNIYTLCYPTGNRQVAKPPLGWIRAEAIRDKYYLDEIFFYLHMHIANCYTNKRLGVVVISSSSSSMSISIDNFAKSSNKTSTLMIILTDRLKMYLKPNAL